MLHARATPERLSMFSDGVFAVLITVLVLDLRPPELPTFKALLLLWPTWLSYAVSYLFIAIVWTNHHHLLRYATEATPRVMWLALNGATADRPQLRTLTFALSHGDVVIIPDRLSRDTTDLLAIAREMQRAGAGIRSLAELFSLPRSTLPRLSSPSSAWRRNKILGVIMECWLKHDQKYPHIIHS